MTGLLSNAGRSFLRAFAGTLLVFIPGVLAAPNLGATRGLALAATVASLAAGLKAIQVFIPSLSFASLVGNSFFSSLLDSFARAFLGSFTTLMIGLLGAPEFSASKSAIVAALVAAVTTGIRGVQGLATSSEEPSAGSGFEVADRAAMSENAQQRGVTSATL